MKSPAFAPLAILAAVLLSACAHHPSDPPTEPRLPVLAPELTKPPPPEGWFLQECLKVLTSAQCSGS